MEFWTYLEKISQCLTCGVFTLKLFSTVLLRPVPLLLRLHEGKKSFLMEFAPHNLISTMYYAMVLQNQVTSHPPKNGQHPSPMLWVYQDLSYSQCSEEIYKGRPQAKSLARIPLCSIYMFFCFTKPFANQWEPWNLK